MSDTKYMQHAIELAQKGTGFVNPNPLVGAVIVKNGKIIGVGHHQVYGGPHAEVNAFSALTEPAKGATMYVTLEPCSHFGKTPPCVDAVIASGVARVVVGSLDPNPLVAGRSITKMRAAGIEVEIGVLKAECDALNTEFFYYITTKMPYVIMKYAMTADGKIATRTGAARWITGAAARAQVHADRHRYTGIMVGIGTVLADDPMLDCRTEKDFKNPIRIICDSTLQTPITSKVVATAKQIPTVILTACADSKLHEPYLGAGCTIISVPLKGDHLNLAFGLCELGKMGIDSILLEGGATLNAAMLAAKLVQRVQTYIAPKIFGGKEAPSPIAGLGVDTPDNAYKLINPKTTVLGGDILIEAEVDYPCSQE